jgi:hypothetical protein
VASFGNIQHEFYFILFAFLLLVQTSFGQTNTILINGISFFTSKQVIKVVHNKKDTKGTSSTYTTPMTLPLDPTLFLAHLQAHKKPDTKPTLQNLKYQHTSCTRS